jgi:hypothetical protein
LAVYYEIAIIYYANAKPWGLSRGGSFITLKKKSRNTGS